MIIGSVHTLSPSLVQSSQEFRAQLDNQRVSKATDVPPINKPELPQGPPPDFPGPIPSPLDTDQIGEAAQERRDSARKTAVHTAELRQTQKAVDTYIKVSSDDDDSVKSATFDPAQVYHASMTYSRRMDLADAFEKAWQRDPEESRINIVV